MVVVSLALVAVAGVAGLVGAGRRRRVRRVRRAGVRAAARRAAAGLSDRAAGEVARRFRCATPCCTCRGPATRRASFCSPSAWARSSSSACGRCRRACCEEFSIKLDEQAADMFLLDIQRDQVEGVRAFLADPVHGATHARLIPVLRARITGVSGRQTNLDGLEGRARARIARPRVHHHVSRSPRGERADRRRAPSGADRPPIRRCPSSGACTSGLPSTSATRCASTFSAARSPRA